MTDDELIAKQAYLQSHAARLLQETPILNILRIFGKPTETGSSTTGLMAYPDIDFAVQTDSPDVQKAVDLLPKIFRDLNASEVKITEFPLSDSGPHFYIGAIMPFANLSWKIDATICPEGPIVTDPPELATWIKSMTPEQRVTILRLKNELIDTQRYGGARSQPPYTFRSTHLYEGVLVGNARTIVELESFYR